MDEGIILSVEKFREFIEKSGCSLVIGVFIALVFILSAASFSCGRSNPSIANQSNIITTIGTYDIDGNLIEKESRSDNDPKRMLTNIQENVKKSVSDAIALKFGIEKNIDFSDETVLKEESRRVEKSLEFYIYILKLQGKIQDTKNQQEVDKALKEAFKVDRNEFIHRSVDRLKQELAHPMFRQKALASRAKDLIEQAYAKKITVSDEELRKSYDMYYFDEMSFYHDTTSKESALDLAEKALKELNSGVDFHKVKQKYVPGYKMDSKNLEKHLISYSRKDLNSEKEGKKTLLELKEGELSKVITQFGTPHIYKLVRIENKLPEDYAKEKNKYKSEYISKIAKEKVKKELEDYEKEFKVEWKSPVYTLLDQFEQLKKHGYNDQDKQNRIESLNKIYQESSELALKPENGKIPGLIRYVALDDLWKKFSEEEKKSRVDDKTGSISFLLEYLENVELRLELTELYKFKKDSQAGASLLEAARNNGALDHIGQRNYIKIQQMIEDLKKENLITKDEEASVLIELKRWAEDKKEQDLAQEEMRRKHEEEIKKEEAARAKEKNQEKKSIQSDSKSSDTNAGSQSTSKS